jgi:tetraacyldisaccharide 4'-kinase
MRAPDFWNGTRPTHKLWAALLWPLGTLYGCSIEMRRRMARPLRVSSRVICVGNLTAGGSGKTPVAIAIGRMLLARGKKVVFLSRGYGGTLTGPVEVDLSRHTAADAGDEALLLAANAPTVVARDRASGAKLCETLGADVIVMDDGHQNFALAKDLSLVVVNAAQGFGNGKLIPAGPLRETPQAGLARADAVLLMGRGYPTLPAFKGPVIRARAFPVSPGTLKDVPVFAFAGIAEPKRFFDLVPMTGAKLTGCQSFADHHVFTAIEMTVLRMAAQANGARLVTTEKDYVRLAPMEREGVTPVPIAAAFDEHEKTLAALLDRLWQTPEERLA